MKSIEECEKEIKALPKNKRKDLEKLLEETRRRSKQIKENKELSLEGCKSISENLKKISMNYTKMNANIGKLNDQLKEFSKTADKALDNLREVQLKQIPKEDCFDA